MNIVRNGYDSTLRSVGIGIGNTSTNARVRDNATFGFDIGMGPSQAHQAIPYHLGNHFSLMDELPIDPRGVIMEQN